MLAMTQIGDTDIWGLLRGIDLFLSLDDAALESLAAGAERLHLRGGEVLLREGDPPDALYVVASGRLQALVTAEGVETIVGEIGRGEVVGEMGILADETRSATVVALRDSNLLRFSRERFVKFLHDHPEALFSVSRLLIQRLRRSIRADAGGASLRTVAIVPIGDDPRPATFARHLTSMLSEWGVARLVSGDDVDASLGDDQLTRHLHDLEETNDLLVYLADPEPSSWTRRCLRQADRIMLVAPAEIDQSVRPVERTLLGPAAPDETKAQVDLVLIHPDHAARPDHGVRWLGGRRIKRLHHVRLHARDDLLRVARALTHREVALVLSGGGARGAAHIGVLKALQEQGIPLDAIGGASFGSIIGGGIAYGMDWEELRHALWEHVVMNASMIDLTAPAVSLARGQRAIDVLHALYGNIDIEDLWLPFFCVSSDLTNGRLMIHDRGPLWKAIRASIAIPGLFPPVRSADGEVLVDGSVMNNLPVDVMETFYGGGVIIAVNLKGSAALPSGGLPENGVLSGWGPMARRLNPLADSAGLPGIVELLLRSTETANVLAANRLEQQAHIVLRPAVGDYGLLAFQNFDRLIDAGYQHVMEEMPRYEDMLKPVL